MTEQTACYRRENIEDFLFNPLIEALPEPLEPADIITTLMTGAPYSRTDREGSVSRRLLLTQRIAQFHQPMAWDADIFNRIDRSIRWGYAERNPLLSGYAYELSMIDTVFTGRGNFAYMKTYHPHTYGFSILGISGIGKTTTIEGILSLYPQVIHHQSYHHIPFILDQIVWLKLDCPCDGSLKGLCLDFFRSIDSLLDTEYCYQYGTKHTTLDRMLTAMTKLCSTYSIGLLVIDEIQSLCTAAKGVPQKVLNFLVRLVNTIGVPVITIGTPKALSILQDEFQQAKRGSGQGDALWERMKEDGVWDVFCRALWVYQYTGKDIPLTDEMKAALYYESQGIAFIAVHLYKLVQEDAILSGKESFTADDLHRIASKKMRLTEPMRTAMRNGTEVDLRQYVDITPFSSSDYADNYSVAAESVSPAKEPVVPPEISIQEEAVYTLMGMGLDHGQAESYVYRILADDKSDAKKASAVARKAFMRFLEDEEHPSGKKDKGLLSTTGYDGLLEKGLIDEHI